MYFVWGIFYTVCDVPYWGLIGATFTDERERVNVISLVRTAGTIALALVTLCSPWIARLLSFGEETTSMGWTLAAILISVLGMALFTLAFFNTREKKSVVDSPPVTLKLIITTLVKNRPLLLVLLGSIVGFGRYIVQTGGAVFAVVAYNDEGLFTLIGASIILGLLLSVIGTQFLLRKFNDRKLMIASSLFGALAYVIMYLLGFQSIYVVCLMIFLTGLSLGSFSILQTTMLFNSVDHIEKCTGVRNDGISCSMLTFVSKLMGTFAMLAFGTGLVISKYESGVVVTEVMQNIVWFTITIVPAISCLLSAVPFFFYKLPKATTEKR
jgi:GPH family glycoside/pentoside/hexuronide:cation symporter